MSQKPSARSTLVGVATGSPDGGVAVVRLSGPEACGVARALVGTLPQPRRLARRRIVIDGAGKHGDDGLVVHMPGPGSFTGEDVIELHVHAGARNVRAVVEACLARGARPAGPGDFSRRAFENGRMTLDQAEGIAAIIGARTDEALAQARRLASGELGRQVEAIRDALVDLRAEIEANLDFPEDVDPGDVVRWNEEVAAIARTVADWLARFEAGRRARERARIVLAGPPNAGKSSLFNALLGQARAIVADRPGTTRDYVEAELTLGRHGAILVDTAGLRDGTGDDIEAAGIALTRDQLEGSDLVLWVQAADTEAEPPPLPDHTVVRVETKRDLGCRRPDWLGLCLAQGRREGLDELERALEAWFAAQGDTPWIGLVRHRDRAREALAELDRTKAHLQSDAHLELAAFTLAATEHRLGEITGRSALGPIAEEITDRIFARFCIGK
jgi:tRNA modification GTPase